INVELIRQWLKSCKGRHQHKCTDARDAQRVPGFKVIDCRAKLVVEVAHQDCQYVALSYVWGDQAPSSYTDVSYPRSIEDAIEVCLLLGYEYLWVDKYCIDQQDATETRVQVQMMDSIYSQAQLNIVAAVGQNSNYGLPGVGPTHRVPQQRLRIGDIELVQMFQSGEKISESKWGSRGWT
ncbi:HET-domain-containing protein, partial [Clathrospora elynae]